jgi:hypothetical protein
LGILAQHDQLAIEAVDPQVFRDLPVYLEHGSLGLRVVQRCTAWLEPPWPSLVGFRHRYFKRFYLRNKVRVRSHKPRPNVSDPKTATKKESRFNPCWPVMYTTAPPTIDRTANMKTAHFSLSISPILIIRPHQLAARCVVDTLRTPKRMTVQRIYASRR